MKKFNDIENEALPYGGNESKSANDLEKSDNYRDELPDNCYVVRYLANKHVEKGKDGKTRVKPNAFELREKTKDGPETFLSVSRRHEKSKVEFAPGYFNAKGYVQFPIGLLKEIAEDCNIELIKFIDPTKDDPDHSAIMYKVGGEIVKGKSEHPDLLKFYKRLAEISEFEYFSSREKDKKE